MTLSQKHIPFAVRKSLFPSVEELLLSYHLRLMKKIIQLSCQTCKSIVQPPTTLPFFPAPSSPSLDVRRGLKMDDPQRYRNLCSYRREHATCQIAHLELYGFILFTFGRYEHEFNFGWWWELVTREVVVETQQCFCKLNGKGIHFAFESLSGLPNKKRMSTLGKHHFANWAGTETL